MFKYVRVKLSRSETTELCIDVAPWEVPVLATVNGDERVRVIGETPVDFPIPSAEHEYARLVQKYGHDVASDQAFVAIAYGAGARGLDELSRLIAKAKTDAAAPPVQSEEYDAKDDPLAGLFDAPPPVSLAEGAIEIAQ